MKSDIQVNIYIVDSKPDYSDELGNALQSHLNVKLHRFMTGEQFLEYVHAHGVPIRQVHVAVVAFRHASAVDYVMNGLEVLEVVQRIAPSVRVVMVGEQEDLEFGAQARSNGAGAIVMYTQCTSLQLSALVLRIVSPLRKSIRKKQLTLVSLELLVSVAILSVCIFFIVNP